ncbi:MAG: late competence development ComFB family protein [Candidatus Omnitrophica bacterium]|nr:late competence development ComFB family protein [Candidatus Omnitrophota bacterium]
MTTAVRTQTTTHTHLTNYMEELAADVLKNLLLEYKGESFSTRAIEDIKALALNRLWPMYTTSTRGKDFLRKLVVEDKVEGDVVRELRTAIEVVRSKPRA